MSQPPENLEVGRVIDRKYRLDSVLRQSPRSIVYRAEHTGIQRFVEVKTLPPNEAAEGPAAARLLREARSAGSVAHRNVQSVVDSGTDELGRPFVVYEALEGATLEDVLRNHPGGMPASRAARLMIQVLEGLNAVHLGGVIHRAIEPTAVRTVPVGDGELVKICGFHEAIFLAEAPYAEPAIQLPPKPYIAPEYTRPGALRYAVDVYAAGALFRALLTGDPEPGGRLSDSARRAIARATAPSLDERFPDAELFLNAVSLMVRSSKRPPRDELDLPEDPLHADFHYLQMRRQVGHIDRVTQVGGTRVRLLPVLLAIEAIYKDLGDAQWTELVERVPEVEDILPGSGFTESNRERGVPVQLVGRIFATADGLGGRGDLGLLVGVGERMARRGLRRLLPSLAESQSPDQVVDGFPELWGKVVGSGKVEVMVREPGVARMVIRGQAEPKLELCAIVAGVVRGAMVDAGARDVEVHLPACQAVGDPTTVFALGWRP